MSHATVEPLSQVSGWKTVVFGSTVARRSQAMELKEPDESKLGISLGNLNQVSMTYRTFQIMWDFRITVA